MKKVGIKIFYKGGSYPSTERSINEKLEEAEKELGKPVDPINVDYAQNIIFYSYEE